MLKCFYSYRNFVVFLNFSNGLAVTKRFYESAFEHYQRARGLLDTRENNSDLWDLVIWELSTSKFTLAQQLFDCYCAGEQVSTFFFLIHVCIQRKTKHFNETHGFIVYG